MAETEGRTFQCHLHLHFHHQTPESEVRPYEHATLTRPSTAPRMAPASTPTSRGAMDCTVTPVLSSRFAMAHCTGAAPRYIGRAEGWTLSACANGCSSGVGMICPKDAVRRRWVGWCFVKAEGKARPDAGTSWCSRSRSSANSFNGAKCEHASLDALACRGARRQRYARQRTSISVLAAAPDRALPRRHHRDALPHICRQLRQPSSTRRDKPSAPRSASRAATENTSLPQKRTRNGSAGLSESVVNARRLSRWTKGWTPVYRGVAGLRHERASTERARSDSDMFGVAVRSWIKSAVKHGRSVFCSFCS